MNTKKRTDNHKVVIHLIPNLIIYQIMRICKLDERGFQGVMLMILIWLMGLVTGFIWAVLKYGM